MEEKIMKDFWTQPGGGNPDQLWTGETRFDKQPKGQKLPYENINENIPSIANHLRSVGLIDLDLEGVA